MTHAFNVVFNELYDPDETALRENRELSPGSTNVRGRSDLQRGLFRTSTTFTSGESIRSFGS